MKPVLQKAVKVLAAWTFGHFLLHCNAIGAEAPDYEYTYTWGDDGSNGLGDLCVDSDGNVVFVGTLQRTLDFDPTDGIDQRFGLGGSGDSFVTKILADGEYGWTQIIGGESYEGASAVAVDGNGNIFVGGTFLGIVDFDPSEGVDYHIAQGFLDAYVTKLDPNGCYLYTWTVGAFPYQVAGVHGLAIDPGGNALITGDFGGSADFDPSEAIDQHSVVGGTSNDVFVTKLTNDGDYLWARTWGSGSADMGLDIAFGDDSSVYIVGNLNGFANMVDLDPTEGEDWHPGHGGELDGFITKLSKDGCYEWAHSFGGVGSDDPVAVVTGLESAVFLTGNFEWTVDFDPGAGEDIRTASPGWWCETCAASDMFLTKYLSDGAYAWTATFGGGTADYANDVALDPDGNPVITGEYGFPVDFDPTEGVDLRDSTSGTQDIFVTQLRPDGGYGWTLTMNGIGNDDAGKHLGFDADGNLYVTGEFEYTIDFDPGEGVDEYTSAGYTDFFITKFTPETQACMGDVNADGKIDPLDSGFVLSRLGCPTGHGDPLCDSADSNLDGLVDPLDVDYVLSRFGPCQ